MSETFHKYTWFENELRRQILTGILPENKPIRSETILAKKYQLSRNTIRHGIENLVREGLLIRVHGSGTYVVPQVQRKSRRCSLKKKKTILRLTFPPYSNVTYQNDMLSFFSDVQFLLKQKKYEFQSIYISDEDHVPDILNKGNTIAGIIFDGNVSIAYYRHYIQPYPCIRLNNYDTELDCSGLNIGKYMAGELSVHYLYQNGHRRIGFLSDENETWDSRELHKGYRSALLDLGIAIRPAWEVCWMRAGTDGILGNESVYCPRDITEYLKPVLSSPEAPTAFVCYDVWRAICLKSSLELLGYQVPDDISIIANFRSDDYPFYAQKTRFTSYQLRTRELWQEGLKMLFDMIENPDMIKQKEISLIPFFVPGETVKTLHE
ncbi:MAG: substrate-binding domain-containing protein [Lentisphaeria bacterium]|nr:substrate-binding domain-containing protein [Lentisphaeria bacterium]